jgi:hypothetical protein
VERDNSGRSGMRSGCTEPVPLQVIKGRTIVHWGHVMYGKGSTHSLDL